MTSPSGTGIGTGTALASSGRRFLWLKYFNAGAVTVLGVCVCFLFFQLQVVTYKLSQEHSRVTTLFNEVQNAQQNQIDQLDQKVQQNQTFTVLHMAGTFVLIASLITMFHMSLHLRSFHEPIVQRKILAILWMSPVYALTSFVSIVVPALEGYMAILKDFYEAYVIYTFLSFLIVVLGRGKRQVVVDLLAGHADHLAKPYRCLNWLFHPNPDESPTAKANAVLLECQILAMQFVFFRPITSIASFVVSEMSREEQESTPGMSTTDGGNGDDTTISGEQATQMLNYFASPQFWISMLQNISVFFAFAGLLKFYHAVQSDLAWCQPFPKFLCIKGVVFMTFWQGLLINIVISLKSGGDWEDPNGGDDPRDKALQIQNVLICLEMLFFSIAHWCTFPVEEWEEGYSKKQYESPGMGFRDFASDVGEIMMSRRQVLQQRRATEGNYINVRDSTVLPEPEVDGVLS